MLLAASLLRACNTHEAKLEVKDSDETVQEGPARSHRPSEPVYAGAFNHGGGCALAASGATAIKEAPADGSPSCLQATLATLCTRTSIGMFQFSVKLVAETRYSRTNAAK